MWRQGHLRRAQRLQIAQLPRGDCLHLRVRRWGSTPPTPVSLPRPLTMVSFRQKVGAAITAGECPASKGPMGTEPGAGLKRSGFLSLRCTRSAPAPRPLQAA
jgi:hypothetical protein